MSTVPPQPVVIPHEAPVSFSLDESGIDEATQRGLILYENRLKLVLERLITDKRWPSTPIRKTTLSPKLPGMRCVLCTAAMLTGRSCCTLSAQFQPIRAWRHGYWERGD